MGASHQSVDIPQTAANAVDGWLLRFQHRLRQSVLAWRLVVGTRLLLAVGFIPTGMVKLLGRPFTMAGPETPIGLFFYNLFQSGAYWQFLGGMQVLAGLMVLVPATATLGAAMFFGIILNIFVITVALGFTGTPFITGPMLLASGLLLMWDYHRLRGLLFAGAAAPATPPIAPLSRLERACYGAGLACGLAFFSGTRGAPLPGVRIWVSVAGLSALAAVVLGITRALRER